MINRQIAVNLADEEAKRNADNQIANGRQFFTREGNTVGGRNEEDGRGA